MKKITAILVAICMTITCLPLAGVDVNAAAGQGKIKKVKYQGRIITTGGTVKDVPRDSLIGAKDIVREYANQVYEAYVNSTGRSHYSDDVWKEIDEAYENVQLAIDGATKVRDLYTSDGFNLYLNPAIGEELEMIASLSTFIKHKVKSKKDIDPMCKRFVKEVKGFMKEFEREYFNDFYWGILQNIRFDAENDMKNIKTFREYIVKASKTAEALGSIAVYDVGEAIVSDDEEESILISLVESTAEDDGLIIILFDEEDTLGIYSKDGVEVERMTVVERLNLYVKNRLAQAKYKGNKAALYKEIDDFKTKVLDKLEDVNDIHDAGDKKLKALIKKTGVDCPDITKAGFGKAAREYNALTNDYNENNYSEGKWDEVEMLFIIAKKTIENAEKEYEVFGVVAELKKELKKIPTIDKEFKSKKTAAEKTLKGFMLKNNKRKYNQSKVKVVVKNGLAALAKVKKYEVEEIDRLRNLYVRNAKKCINKYRITTSKKGKGTITKSKTVAYGASCTITLTPKPGYKIKKVLLNGKKTKLKSKYVFKNVKKKQRIKAIFGK